MKKLVLAVVAVTIGLVGQAGALAGQKGVSDEQLGLFKADVDNEPAPPAFHYRDQAPFSGKVLPRAYLGAPPQVPHEIKDFTPITRENNMCLGCHQQPDMIGKKVKGQPTPMPASHYVDVKTNTMYMGRYVCTQCHTPQAMVKPLVTNTFGGKK